MSNEIIGFGVCRLTVVPVRKEANHRAEQVTQLLFGDQYQVLATDAARAWLYIQIHSDQYTGWISGLQHHEVAADYFEQSRYADYKITTETTATILYQKSPITIVMGSIVPITGNELFKMEDQFAFNGESKNLSQRRDADFVLQTVQKYLSAPYQWGGKSPFGIDCSGLVQMVFKISGYNLLRDAAQQFTQGKPVATLAEALPGDLAFFQSEDGRIVHVGIVAGSSKVIHASGHVRISTLGDAGIFEGDHRPPTHVLAGIRRILPTPD
jgi:cell wall-associated NlpC family hydrolase